jgi:hypothetical protein
MEHAYLLGGAPDAETGDYANQLWFGQARGVGLDSVTQDLLILMKVTRCSFHCVSVLSAAALTAFEPRSSA